MLVQERDPFVWLAPGLAGDESSYRTYADSVTRGLRCYFAGHGCGDADDLASESMLRLVRKLADGEPQGCASETERKRYLFGIARNVLREWRRRPDARETCLDEDAEFEFNLPPIDLIARQCLELLRQAVRDNLAKLSPIEQDILHQSELNPEYSSTLAALAKTAGTKASAMRQRARRARIRFRNLVLGSDRIADLLKCLGIERTET
jgi:RNA polymerase sigma factor (sigma-70 family)